MAENALITIERPNALAIFSTPDGVDPLLKHIRDQIDAFEADVRTKKGRDEIASIAYRIATSKTYLDGIGKALVDDLKDVPKKIDASRKRVRDTLDSWREEVRAPLTAWETAEAERVARHRGTIARLTEIATAPNAGCVGETTPAQFAEKIAKIAALEINPASCDEFEAEYARGKDAALRALKGALAAAETREAEAAELARLRAAEAAREAAEREAREATERAERAEAERIERERIAATAAEVERRRAEQAIADAERRALEAEERAARDAAAAVEQAKRQAEADAAREREAEEKRARNRRHAGKIHSEIVAALVAGGLDDTAAKATVALIAGRKVPHIVIEY